jgi:phage-related protein (TIGR01555 family)
MPQPETPNNSVNDDAESAILHNDGALIDALQSIGGSGVSNPVTGLGTSRDKTAAAIVPKQIRKLTDRERIALFRSSRIARRAVEAYPIAAGGVGWEWTFGGSSTGASKLAAKMGQYCDRLKVKDAFVSASIEGRWHGDGFILIGAADGLDLDQPLGKVRTIEWLEVLGEHEVQPGLGQHYKDNPEYYTLSGHSRVGTVHESRILRFRGDRLLGLALQENAGKNDSVLQTMMNAFVQFTMGLGASTGMLADYSVFKYKLKGLSKLIMSGQTDELIKRFIAIQMGMSITQGLMMDAENEEAEFIQRNYSGVKDIVDLLTEQLVAASDMPRTKLLGAAARTGLGTANRGDGDREDWEIMRADWQENNWRDPLMKLGAIILSASDGPTKGARKDFGVSFPSGLRPNPREQAQVRLVDMQRFKLAIEANVLTAEEVRQSLYGNAGYSSEITLQAEKISKGQQQQQEGDKIDAGNGVARQDAIESAIDLAEFARVSEEDLIKAREAWEANPPKKEFEGILEAEEQDE